ncbi:hypothetical protein [Microbacterium testaceum]|uniref:hypothetical protein n=1 Tax=Microbacterium testaceum TaxID=2033 RepID=UPI00177C35FF|nr:hypothetical protein [Microbacterium testaceum]
MHTFTLPALHHHGHPLGSDHDDDVLAGFAPACASCGGVVEPLERGAAAWWHCPRCGLARLA